MEESKYAKTDSIEEACHFPVTVPTGHMHGSPSTDASEGIFILHMWQFLTTKNRIILTKQSGRPLKLKVVIRCRKK